MENYIDEKCKIKKKSIFDGMIVKGLIFTLSNSYSAKQYLKRDRKDQLYYTIGQKVNHEFR